MIHLIQNERIDKFIMIRLIHNERINTQSVIHLIRIDSCVALLTHRQYCMEINRLHFLFSTQYTYSTVLYHTGEADASTCIDVHRCFLQTP